MDSDKRRRPNGLPYGVNLSGSDDDHAGVNSTGRAAGDQFRSALASRDIIGQAKGIMERYDMSAVAAFKILIKLSQESNTPIHDLATQLVHKDHPPDVRETMTNEPPVSAGRCGPMGYVGQTGAGGVGC